MKEYFMNYIKQIFFLLLLLINSLSHAMQIDFHEKTKMQPVMKQLGHKLNVLVLGCGGREHMIAKKICESPRCHSLHCLGSYLNPGLEQLIKNKNGKLLYHIANPCDPVVVAEYARNEHIDLVVIGPEAPLENGVSDALWEAGVYCIGPTKRYAQIETSKGFARELFKKYSLEGYIQHRAFKAHGKTFLQEVMDTLEEFGKEYVIKADGLKGGKGVQVAGDHLKNHLDAIRYICGFADGEQFVVERKVYGREFTLMSFCDGHSLAHMPIARDFKRAFEGDQGPNTGGMGSYSDCTGLLPDLTAADRIKAEKINEAVVHTLSTELGKCTGEIGYVGILYGSFMKTIDGDIKVIEYNARFGDPEAINVLSVLETDLLEIFVAMAEQRLNEISVSFANKATVCKYLVPEGYPEHPIKGDTIDLSQMQHPEMLIYGSVRQRNGKSTMELEALGSRALAIVAAGNSIEEAEKLAEMEIKTIKGKLFHRSDIGKNIPQMHNRCLTYKDASIELEKNDVIVEGLQKFLPEIGSFGGLCTLEMNNVNSKPILVGSIDGVGTKSMIAELVGNYDSLGEDIVNHGANDVLVEGAEPLFFLDYLATDQIDPKVVVSIVNSMHQACQKINCKLIGGETAEMTDVYRKGHWDIVGCMVGIIPNPIYRIDSTKIVPGDIVLGVASTGLHTNGFTLVRRLFSEQEIKQNKELAEALLKPHHCYLPEVKTLFKEGIQIKGLCHITGGGLIGNPPRILPKNTSMLLNPNLWSRPKIFDQIEQRGVSKEEMYRIFNCGLGMLIIVPCNEADQALQVLQDRSKSLDMLPAYKVGEIVPKRESRVVISADSI
jgi:phosphoribosylamine--glycine ligase/phosphoribosylaminoimidazole synthetase